MPVSAASFPVTHEARGAEPRRGRLRLVAVTAAAVFLVVLTVLGRPGRIEPVRAVVGPGQVEAPDLAAQFADAAQTIQQPDNLLTAALQSTPQGFSTDEAVLRRQLEQDVSVTARTGAEGAPRLELVYSGTLPGGADLINTLTNHYLEEHFAEHLAALLERRDEADQAAEDAATETEDARQRLALFVADHSAAPTAAGEKTETAEAAPPENPAWETLHGQVEQLTAERFEVLAKVTPAHPLVLELNSRIEQLLEQLSGTPRYVSTEGRPPSAESTGNDPSQADAVPAVPPQSDRQAQAEERRQLEEEVEMAATYERDVRQASLAAREAVRTAGEQRLKVIQWALPQPPAWPGRLLATVIALALATVCGVVVARGAASTDQGIDEDEHGRPQPALPRWCRRVQLFSELTLVLFAGCIVVLAVGDPQFFTWLRSAPFEVVSGSLWRAAELLRS